MVLPFCPRWNTCGHAFDIYRYSFICGGRNNRKLDPFIRWNVHTATRLSPPTEGKIRGRLYRNAQKRASNEKHGCPHGGPLVSKNLQRPMHACFSEKSVALHLYLRTFCENVAKSAAKFTKPTGYMRRRLGSPASFENLHRHDPLNHYRHPELVSGSMPAAPRAIKHHVDAETSSA